MRGEFLSVWRETYREIWAPLAEQEGVPNDVFSQLYGELAAVLRDPAGDAALAVPLSDAIQLRLAFHRALALSGIEIELVRADEAFEASGATTLDDTMNRRLATEGALAVLIGDPAKTVDALDIALRELASDPQRRAEAKERAIEAILNDTAKSREAFERVQPNDLVGERALIDFLETASAVFEDVGGDELSNRYFNLLTDFIEKFSLRYDLRRPCTLCPTLAGMFSSLVRSLRVMTGTDAHLDGLMKDFENALRDLRIDSSDARIRNSIQKQVILLEALGQNCPGVTEDTLGAICGQLQTWPHDKVQEAMKNLYKFTNNYPGIRHAGDPASALRLIDMRDLVAVSILLAGFAPYLSNGLDADVVYRGA